MENKKSTKFWFLMFIYLFLENKIVEFNIYLYIHHILMQGIHFPVQIPKAWPENVNQRRIDNTIDSTQRSNKNLQNIAPRTQDWAAWTPLKSGDEHRCSGRLFTSCFISNIVVLLYKSLIKTYLQTSKIIESTKLTKKNLTKWWRHVKANYATPKTKLIFCYFF